MEHGKVKMKSYVIGYALSLLLTVGAFGITIKHIDSNGQFLSAGQIATYLIVFALCQLIVQLVFFLHLGRESKPRWNLMVFLFMIFMTLVLVVGSLWIMANLEYQHDGHQPTKDSPARIIEDEGMGHHH